MDLSFLSHKIIKYELLILALEVLIKLIIISSMMSATDNKRHVHFLPEKNLVFEVKSLMDYTKQEMLDTWYTTSELRVAWSLRNTAALRWEAGNTPSSFCIRGLERCTQVWGKRIERNIERCVDAVICEQIAQWPTGGDECELLAAVSQEASKPSVQDALARAQEDRLEALRVYKRHSRIKTALRPIMRRIL